VRFLVDRGVPVCAHLGFTPQSVHALGGYRVQGRDETAARVLCRHAEELAAAGAEILVLELVPASVARDLTAMLSIPTIGIGAGAGCSGQVLVLHDMLGVTAGEPLKFVRNFLDGSGSVESAVRSYVAEVKAGRFPDDAIHSF
jgi:3-methyl-2-oxobutanoate hydroxymethyltransferase